MAQGEGFKHITVTAPEDDEVIYAGVEAGGARAPDSGPSQPAPSAEARPVHPEGEAGADGSAAEGASRPAEPPKDSYRDPTLEDLHGSPMPLAQKIVIAMALVCIIGAVIYYLASMG